MAALAALSRPTEFKFIFNFFFRGENLINTHLLRLDKRGMLFIYAFPKKGFCANFNQKIRILLAGDLIFRRRR